jgi:hypothetical protein
MSAEYPPPDPAPEPVLNPVGAAVLSPPLSSSADVIQQQTSAQDYVVLRFAVAGLVIAVVVSLIGVLALGFVGKEVPEGILAIGSAAVGALSTMLVRPQLFPSGPPAVIVGDRRKENPRF